MDIQDFSELETEMIEDGLTRGLEPSPECAQDREIIEGDHCSECGRPVAYEVYSRYLGLGGFMHTPQWRSRVFGVCRQCNAAFEF